MSQRMTPQEVAAIRAQASSRIPAGHDDAAEWVDGLASYVVPLCDTIAELERDNTALRNALLGLQYGPYWDRCWCSNTREFRLGHSGVCRAARAALGEPARG